MHDPASRPRRYGSDHRSRGTEGPADAASITHQEEGAPMTLSPMSPPQSQLSRASAATDTEVVMAIAHIGRELKSREREITEGMTALMAREIDHLDDDPQLVEMLEASVHGNVATVIHVLINDIPVDHLQPTTAAVEYARRLAQRDVPSNSLVRAYHMGQHAMLRICHDEIAGRGLPAPLTLAVIKRLTEIIYSYVDWITLYVFDAYEAERTRWMNARGSVRSATLHAVLSADRPDTSTFETETGYRLMQTHLALILWRPGPEQPSTLNMLDTQARAIAKALHTNGPPIVTAIDRRTVWAWLPFGRCHPATDTTKLRAVVDLTDGTRLAVGLPSHGLEGFRRSHQQAGAAYFIATVPGASSPHPVIGFGDPGVAAASSWPRIWVPPEPGFGRFWGNSPRTPTKRRRCASRSAPTTPKVKAMCTPPRVSPCIATPSNTESRRQSRQPAAPHRPTNSISHWPCRCAVSSARVFFVGPATMPADYPDRGGGGCIRYPRIASAGRTDRVGTPSNFRRLRLRCAVRFGGCGIEQ